MSFSDYQKEMAQQRLSSTNLSNDIQETNKNSISESLPADELESEKERKKVPKKPILYDYANPSGFNFNNNSLKASGDNSRLHGEYINVDGEFEDLNISGFMTLDGKSFGANGLVYVKPMHSPAGDWITDKTERSLLEYKGDMASLEYKLRRGIQVAGRALANEASKWDPETVLRMLVPGINPRNGEPILKEVVGTKKELIERGVAISQAYGFQESEEKSWGIPGSHVIKGFSKDLLNTLLNSDQTILGAASMFGIPLSVVNNKDVFEILHRQAIAKNELYNYIPSEKSSERLTWDWFSSGLGSAFGSQVQFGYAGRVFGAVGKGLLNLGGTQISQNFAKRKAVETIARYSASGTVGFGYAMTEARKSGLDNDEAFMFSLVVGSLNTLIESKLNINLDRTLMGQSTMAVTRGLMREINGVVTNGSLDKGFQAVLKSILAGGTTALKRMGSETVEEVLQTGVEQTGRTLHDFIKGEGRTKGEGRFSETGFDEKEMFDAGFFGAMAAGPTAIASTFYKQDDGYMTNMIMEDKGALILSGIDDLLASGKISPAKHAEIKKDAAIKIESYQKNKQAFLNIKGMKYSKTIRRDLLRQFEEKANLDLKSNEVKKRLAQNPNATPAVAMEEAKKIKAELDKIETQQLENQKKIDKYADRNFVEEENSRYKTLSSSIEQQNENIFEQITQAQASAADFNELYNRYISFDDRDRSITAMFFNATEAKIFLDAIRNGEAAKMVGDKNMDVLIDMARAHLEDTKFYLHPSINTDSNRDFLVKEIGIDETSLPLTASERQQALTDPGKFKGRYISRKDFDEVFLGKAFQEDVDSHLAKIEETRDNIDSAALNSLMYQLMLRDSEKYGITTAMLYSMNETSEVLALLENDAQEQAFGELIDKSNKPFSLVSLQSPEGRKASGMHHEKKGVVALQFNKARMMTLIAQRPVIGLSKKEQKELKNLQEDLFHKLTHETSHNLFDSGVSTLYYAFQKARHTGVNTAESLLYERLVDLAKFSYVALSKSPSSKKLYFFNTIVPAYNKIKGEDQIVYTKTLVKEFFAEAMSNKDFQELLDSYDMGASSNKKDVAMLYNYKSVKGGFVKSLLKEVLEAFQGVFSSIKKLLSHNNRTLLMEAMTLGSSIQVNRFGKNIANDIPSVADMDISMYNPKSIIDNLEDGIDLSELPIVISQRLAMEGFTMDNNSYSDFIENMEKFIYEEIFSGDNVEITTDSVKVVYFKTSDSFLILWDTFDGDKKTTNRQFFNRYGRKESLNTNVMNPNAESHVKKPYGFDDYKPENDGDEKSILQREISDNFMAAQREGFVGKAELKLNEEKVFGTRAQQYRGEIEIVYTYADGSQKVIGYAPDLAKPRLAKFLQMEAEIPVILTQKGKGSEAFVLYNDPGVPESGIKRAVNPRTVNNEMTPEMVIDGYVEVIEFLPRTTFTYDSDNVKVTQKATEAANASDTLTSMDGDLVVNLNQFERLTNENFINHEYDQDTAESVLGSDFSLYADLDSRKEFDAKAWYFRDKMAKEIRYKAMTGIFKIGPLDNAFSMMTEMVAKQLSIIHSATEFEIEKAKRLGFPDDQQFLEFKDSIVSENAIGRYVQEAKKSIKQDWDGHGLNPNDTVFAMVKAQLEHLSFLNPSTGLQQMLTIDKARDMLLMATRESADFTVMVEKFKSLQTDKNLNDRDRSIAKTLYNFYSASVTDKGVLDRLALANPGITVEMFSEVSDFAASKATGAETFRNELKSISEGVEIVYPGGTKPIHSKEQMSQAASALIEYYNSKSANYNGLIRYFGSNSLFTGFASMRKVDSISMIPMSDGSSIVSYNGKRKINKEAQEEMEAKVKKVLNELKEKHKDPKIALKELHQRVEKIYVEKYGKLPKDIFDVGKFIYFNQFFGVPDRLSNLGKSGGNGISHNWMENVSVENHDTVKRLIKAYFIALDIDIPDGILMRHSKGNDEFIKLTKAQKMDEFRSEMDSEGYLEGSPKYIEAQEAMEEDLRLTIAGLGSKNYSYPVSKFGRKKSTYDKPNKQSEPMLALAFQTLHWINTKGLSYMNNDADAEIMGDEFKKLTEEILMFGKVNQSDDMYFDPHGNQRFSVKIKSNADKMMEDFSMNKGGILKDMLKNPGWRNNTVLRKIQENQGKPIDVMLSGLRTWAKGTVYEGATDVDFAYMNMAGFTSRYDYTEDYMHVDDIPSDKPNIYGYMLKRLVKDEFKPEIRNIIESEKHKTSSAKSLLLKVFSKEINNGKKGATINNQALFETLIEGVHYEVKDGKYFPGKITKSSEHYFGTKTEGQVLASLKKEAQAIYIKMTRQGLVIPLNKVFITENDPRVILENKKKQLNRLEAALMMNPENKKVGEWQTEITALKEFIKEKTVPAVLRTDIAEYEVKAGTQRQKLFVDEFYPNYTINRYHLSRLLMGDAVFYKNISDMNKRKAGPAAPFYRGSWKRRTANLVALNDVSDADSDKITKSSLPTLSQNANGKWEISSTPNNIESGRTDAQGYVTEGFAQEIIDAYGAFSGFKKIFKPVMFGVNKEFAMRGQPIYMKLSAAIILDPNKEANFPHYAKYPEQRDFALRFYASNGDLALFNTGIKVGFRSQSKVTDDVYKTQPFDLDKFGLQNDPEHTVEDDNARISGGVQIHKSLADNGNFQTMLEFYGIEAAILRADIMKASKDKLSGMESLRKAFIEQMESKEHTAALGRYLKDNSVELFDHPFTSESAQNMLSSLINKLGSLPEQPGMKLVNMSDFGLDNFIYDDIQKANFAMMIEKELVNDTENKERYKMKWTGPRTTSELHIMDQKNFKKMIDTGKWLVDDVTDIILDSFGNPIIFPADILIPENSGLNIGQKTISKRIPTTGKSSVIAGRVVGFLPEQMGNVIVTPKEGPGILGFDFDVDGLFVWNHTNGVKQDMDKMFNIAFGILTDPKNYNEVTTPVGMETLNAMSKIFSTSEQEYETGVKPESETESKMGATGLLDYGFGRQLEMMKMNSVGKAFIGSSASFSAINSVFSQTGTELQDMFSLKFSIKRAYNIEGAERFYPTHDQNGKRVSDFFVQLINAATDNVKEMHLSKNHINLVTGDVLMDMVAHGVDPEYALFFINQPAVRDIVRQNDQNNSVTTSNDYMSAEDRVLQKYQRMAKMVDPLYSFTPTIGEDHKRDGKRFELEKLKEMYKMGDKKLSIEDVNSYDDIQTFFRNKIEPGPEQQAKLLEAIKDQIVIIEKFKFYKSLSQVTRSGGNLVMMFSKNPKNFTELKKIYEKIESTYLSTNPKLNDAIFRHPSYGFQWDLIKMMKSIYHQNMIVAHKDLDEIILWPIIKSLGVENAKDIHDSFLNSVIFKMYESNDISSKLLTGKEISSIEFNEVFIKLLNENLPLFEGNKFMEKLKPDVSDFTVQGLSKGLGNASKIEFDGMSNISEVELNEIEDAYLNIPNMEYEGNVVNTRAALLYYLSITKGFGMGGYNFSKMLPKSSLTDINDTLKGFKDILNSSAVEARINATDENGMFSEMDFIDELASALDPYMLDGLREIKEKFLIRNDRFKSKISSVHLANILKENSGHFDQFTDIGINKNAIYLGPLKSVTSNNKKTLRIASYNTHKPQLSIFLKQAVKNGGFVINSPDGTKTVYVYKTAKLYFARDSKGVKRKYTEEVFEEKELQNVQGIYEPRFFEKSTLIEFVPTKKEALKEEVAQQPVAPSIPWADRVVDVDADIGSVNIAMDNQSVIATVNPQIIPMLLANGYRVSSKNPLLYLYDLRPIKTYTKEQIKKLKNEC